MSTDVFIYRRDGREDVRCYLVRTRPGGTLRNIETGEERPGVQLLLKPVDGGRAFWSSTMAEVER